MVLGVMVLITASVFSGMFLFQTRPQLDAKTGGMVDNQPTHHVALLLAYAFIKLC